MICVVSRKISDVGGARDCAGDRGLGLLGVSALYKTFHLCKSVCVDDIQVMIEVLLLITF